MVLNARPEPTPWVQQFNAENVGYNLAQAHSFRSLTLSIAGSIAGVLGLQNLAGFAFFVLSVAFLNTILLVVNAKGRPSDYFIMGSSPVITDASERLVPSKAAQLRAPPTPVQHGLQLAGWVLLQGAQENVLSFLLWWTFWYAIVHVYD
ncbi:hypothetical protein MOBT1_000155 [Malassezia obtusa]|uniref:ER membrane protein complex subunit 6 n=1 Tax=Malassezia obtusa TaxID=76774 RepID=A0AAF0IQE5_9BASI|nr:hypothetical protein MOBT1_000155 [Malassezia obtusa]